MDLIIGIILLVAAVFLIASVLLQSSKNHKLSGTISGGAETFFGKTKGSSIDRVLSKLTAVVAIVFCVLVVTMYVMQEETDFTAGADSTQDISNVVVSGSDTSATSESGDDTSAEASDTTEATDTSAEASDSTEADTTAEDTTEADTSADDTTSAESTVDEK